MIHHEKKKNSSIIYTYIQVVPTKKKENKSIGAGRPACNGLERPKLWSHENKNRGMYLRKQGSSNEQTRQRVYNDRHVSKRATDLHKCNGRSRSMSGTEAPQRLLTD